MRSIVILLAFLLLFSIVSKAQCPPNIGFEDGTFNGWQCYSGSVAVNTSTNKAVLNISPTAPIPDRHTIIPKNSTELDKYGLFPVVCPNGSNNSIKIGNEHSDKKADQVTYTYTIPPGRAYTLVFYYAVVLQNPNHTDAEQPRFTAKVYDVTDDKPIDCPAFDFIASSALPGFKLSQVPVTNGTSTTAAAAAVYYKDWSATTINLVGYAGKTIRFEFAVNDCTRSGHFGYAYLDLDENCGAAISGNAYCLGQQSVTLHAPAGFSNYTWYNGDLSQQLGQGPILTVSPAPPDLTKYALKIEPFPGLGCIDTLYTTVNQINAGYKLNVLDKIYGCPGSTVDLTAPAVTDGSSPGLTLSYYNDFTESSYLYRPDAVATPGIYYIKGRNAEGCESISSIQVIIDTPSIQVNSTNAATYPNGVNLTKTFSFRNGYTYTYYRDAQATNPLENYLSVTKSGTYYIKATTGNGCSVIAPVNVTIYPPAPYSIKAPNTFTPNGDGVNDRFFLTINGYVAFGNFQIFSRDGQLVFSSKTSAAYWDGTYAGKALPIGVYYWVFEGYDSYTNNKIKQADYITLIR